ncbi:hypothetical protein ACQRET_25040 [Streptomyces koyangensis]|uniref:hypothetical protein n=1 Tax=Streptomyces koyangensis TaxID=188770 RepID=UPI003CFEF6CF
MKKHLGMNSQVLADTFGHLIGAPGAPPATVHELTADRTHDIAATIVAENTRWRADKAHQDASSPCTYRSPRERAIVRSAIAPEPAN